MIRIRYNLNSVIDKLKAEIVMEFSNRPQKQELMEELDAFIEALSQFVNAVSVERVLEDRD